MVQPLWKTICRFLKTQNRVTIRARNPTPRHTPERTETLNSKSYVHPWSAGLEGLGSPSFKTEEKAQENRHINGPGASYLSEARSWRTPTVRSRRRNAAVSTPWGGARLYRLEGTDRRWRSLVTSETSRGRALHPLCGENNLQPGSGASWRKVNAVNGLSAKLLLLLPSRFSRVRLCVTP